MPNLFKKFGRAKSLSSVYANGSGLGLYVAPQEYFQKYSRKTPYFLGRTTGVLPFSNRFAQEN